MELKRVEYLLLEKNWGKYLRIRQLVIGVLTVNGWQGELNAAKELRIISSLKFTIVFTMRTLHPKS